MTNRRNVLTLGAAAAALAMLRPQSLFAAEMADFTASLKSMTGDIKRIVPAEYLTRIAKARKLMGDLGIGALIVEPGSSMIYFTGVDWWRSERLTAAIIPREGEVAIVTPHFEEPSVHESLKVPAEVRIWHEDKNPLEVVAGILRDRKVTAPIAFEETVRYFAIDGLQRVMPHVEVRNGAPIVHGCRLIKSAAEIALMQKASDITIAAYRHTWPRIRPGMTQHDVAGMVHAATLALGGENADELILLGEASAYPHGSGKPQAVREGEVVLFDCGCTVEGYHSDISRTFVYGKASAEQRKVWEQMRQSQQLVIETARVGVPAGHVDDVMRAQLEKWGYGPGYKLPGTPHRTGHGIGLDVHEPVNLVHGETTALAPGMCFSDEPGIYLPGKFGIRLEDCFHMGPEKPAWFSTPPTSLDKPFG